MVATPTLRPPRLPALALLLAGCAVLPPASYPAHVDADLCVRCRVPASGRLEVPATGPDLVVRELLADPPPRGEVFRDGGRFLLYDGGTEVTVRARIRSYADGAPGDRAALFPDAVEWLEPK